MLSNGPTDTSYDRQKKCMDGWMDGWTDGWMDGWMDRSLNSEL